jgi:transketolase
VRNKFANVIYKVGLKDKRICALVADISPAGSMTDFRKKFPNRFINTGVAEQSMIGIAAGLALRGMRPFCYTIATFSLYRPFEMVRVDVCYQNLPVTIIGMGAGLIYSTLGSTHHSFEDISIASSLPNMTVLAPCDPLEMEEATLWCAKRNKGPVYMRLGKRGEPNLTEKAKEKFKIGKIRYLRKLKEKKIVIISYGTIMYLAINVAEKLKKHNVNASIISCHTIKPLDKKGIIKMLREYENIIVIEEHVPTGGLNSSIKNINSDLNHNKSNVMSFTCKDEFIHSYGSYENLLSKHGISESKIINKILSIKNITK